MNKQIKRHNQIVRCINNLLHMAQRLGLDHEQILAEVYAEHLKSDEKCDACHMYGITFAEKLNALMGD